MGAFNWLAGAVCALGFAFGCSSTERSAPPAAPPRQPQPPAQLQAKATPRLDRAAAAHLLDRFTFGPRPGDVDRLVAMGTDAWLERELHPASIPDAAGQAALRPYADVLGSPLELLDRFQKDPGLYGGQPATTLIEKFKRVDTRRLLATLDMAELSRDISSECQLQQVMVDFWANHFNVFARKGFVRFYAADYVEHAIRPHALGRFEDLLVASAEHPAMLLYLDNAKSSAVRQGFFGAKKGGINENYARELMELQTVGVNGGYTQADVIAVARILTGWSIERPKEGGTGFMFRPRLHDWGAKVALGHQFPAGHGEDEGLRLLHILAESPATARHISSELCERFVADSPPKGCVDRLTATYLSTHGDISAMLRTLAHSPEFWAPADYGAKVKSPLEFVASALRAVGGKADGSLGLALVMYRLGEPLLLQPVPTGYGDRAADWMSSDALVGRMNFATALAIDVAPGVSSGLDPLLSPTPDARVLVTRVNDLVLQGQGSARTLQTIEKQVGSLKDPDAARRLAVALALGSPDFQRM
jgi:Protein of unknown function (DUF1800)